VKINRMYRKRRWLFYLPVILCSAAAIWYAATVLMPLPPVKFTFAGGLPQGGYAGLALRYRDQLELRGIQAEIISTDGALGPLKRLSDPSSNVLAGFASGLAKDDKYLGIQALSAVERQPVWLFTRLSSLTQLAHLKDQHIATTRAGTPGWSITQLLLAHAQVDAGNNVVQLPTYVEVANQLVEGKVEVAVMVASANSEAVRLLLRNPAIQIMGIDSVFSLIAREPRLKPFILPQGAIDLRGEVPSRDLTMVSTNINLLVRSSMHPALQRALLDVARDLHEPAALLQRQGEFPNIRDVDFSPSPVARRVDAGDRPVMEQLFPYYWAQWAQLLLFAIVPILLVTILVLLWIPNFFVWKVNALLQHYYGELKFLEAEIVPSATGMPNQMKKLMRRLDQIELHIANLDLPNQYADRWYTLREHCALAREKLLSYRAR
jgi:TRAP-type uncharacterized transport system substrate-binding protein